MDTRQCLPPDRSAGTLPTSQGDDSGDHEKRQEHQPHMAVGDPQVANVHLSEGGYLAGLVDARQVGAAGLTEALRRLGYPATEITCLPMTPPRSNAWCAWTMSASGYTLSTTGRSTPAST
jgi:hypothetical protein